jgi:hypothetical protein
MNSREEKIKSLMRYFAIGWTFLNGGQPLPIELSIELQTQLQKQSDKEINQLYKDLVKSL